MHSREVRRGRLLSYLFRILLSIYLLLKINVLLHMILYVQKSEETSHLKMVHFCEEEKGLPSELEANAKSAFLDLYRANDTLVYDIFLSS